MKRYLSGMQPSGTGNPHLGNYLGAMRQHIAAQEKGECFFFLANYHALTSIRNAEQLRKNTLSLAMDYLALGIDPNKTAFFIQSDVPELTELTWIFNTITPMSLLERAHAWKDAKQKGKKGESVGLFDYPVLMAVDILMYHPDFVPVGQDQKQHVEIAADIAGFFNNTYGEVFKKPQPLIVEDVATVPGTDGQKMSKSYGNVIDIFAPENELKKQVMSIMTDSREVHEAKDPETCLPFQLLSFLISAEEKTDLARQLTDGGMGYGTLKKLLLERLLEHFAVAREKRQELEQKRDYVIDVLKMGGKKARTVAQNTMAIVREKTGLIGVPQVI